MVFSCLSCCHKYLYQQNKSESKVKFRKANNPCKRVLEAAKLACVTKTESIISQKLGFRDLWRIANSVFNKGKSAIFKVNFLYSADWRRCLLHLIKQNYLLKTFLGTLILMSQLSLHRPLLLESI